MCRKGGDSGMWSRLTAWYHGNDDDNNNKNNNNNNGMQKDEF